jgi:hypothetical protein
MIKPARIAGICGLVAFVTFNVGWIAGGLAQPAAYSFANDDTSDVGAVTASSSWIQNRIGANPVGPRNSRAASPAREPRGRSNAGSSSG